MGADNSDTTRAAWRRAALRCALAVGTIAAIVVAGEVDGWGAGSPNLGSGVPRSTHQVAAASHNGGHTTTTSPTTTSTTSPTSTTSSTTSTTFAATTSSTTSTTTPSPPPVRGCEVSSASAYVCSYVSAGGAVAYGFAAGVSSDFSCGYSGSPCLPNGIVLSTCSVWVQRGTTTIPEATATPCAGAGEFVTCPDDQVFASVYAPSGGGYLGYFGGWLPNAGAAAAHDVADSGSGSCPG